MDTWLLRLRSLVSFWALPGAGFLLWACEILGYIHLVSFAIELGCRVNDWAHLHPLLVMVLGFAWLGVLIFWPSIKPHLPELGKTVHERVHEIHAHILPRIEQACAETDARLKVVEAAERKHEAYHVGIEEKVTALEKMKEALDALETHLEMSTRNFSEDLRDLKTSAGLAVDGLRKRAARADKAIELIPSYFWRQDDTTELKSLLGGITLDFQFIREVYPSSAPARLPFSNWRTTIASDATSNPGLLFAENAAQRLERYVEIAQAAALRWGRDVFSGDLFTLVPRWKYASVTEVSGEGFMAILQKHFSELRKIESDYATLWRKTVEESATIS